MVSHVDMALVFVCIRWQSADETDITITIPQILHIIQVYEGECNWLVYFSSILSTDSLFTSTIAISSFTDTTLWTLNCFYLPGFITVSGVQQNLESVFSYDCRYEY